MRKSRCSFFKRDVKKTSCVAFPAYPVAFFCFQLNSVEIFSPRCWWLIVLNGSQWLKRCIILTFMCGMKEVKWSRWASHSVQIHNWSHLQRLCSGSKMLYIPVLQRFLSNILRVTCIVSVFTRAFRQWQVRYFMVYNERALHNCFIPCHRKYNGQPYQFDVRAVQDGKVRCDTLEYTVNFLCSDWLYFCGML